MIIWLYGIYRNHNRMNTMKDELGIEEAKVGQKVLE